MRTPFNGIAGAVPKKGIRGGKIPKITPEQRKKNKSKITLYNNQCEVVAETNLKTAWKWYSIFRRLSSCFDNASGVGVCCTCGVPLHYKDGDAGHCIKQKNNPSVVYNDKNVHLQCKHCNKHLGGNEAVYAVYVDQKYGEGTFVELEEKAKESFKKRALWEVKAMVAEYMQKAKDEAYRCGVTL